MLLQNSSFPYDQEIENLGLKLTVWEAEIKMLSFLPRTDQHSHRSPENAWVRNQALSGFRAMNSWIDIAF